MTEISRPRAPSFRLRTREKLPTREPSQPDPRSSVFGEMSKAVKERERIVVRFAGDSGDGMQLTGDRFTSATAVLGNDLATLPDFPAEIRAPAGTVHGVSAFQIQFASSDITTPGDHADVLIAMNPAALKADLHTVAKGGVLVLNEDSFTPRNIEKAGYTSDPTEDGTLDGYQVYKVPMTSITVRATEDIGIGKKEAERAKNMFALGLVSWMFGRPTETTLNWLEKKFGSRQEIFDANVGGLQGRLSLRRDDGAVRRVLQGGGGAAGAGDLPEHRRRDRARLGAHRGIRAERAAAVLRELPDHAGLRAPP